jgi:phosphatidylserine/phosphatidylglycerophosphate/cardiolipin synthase-like enzyme
MLKVTAAANGDDVVVAWWADEKLAGGLGLALERQATGGDPEFLSTELPFEGQPRPAPGTHKPSSVWPIQRFLWTDHLAPGDVEVRYRVTPVVGDPDTPELATSGASPWTAWVRCATGTTPGYFLYPNRGVVAAPWVERILDDRHAQAADKTLSPSQLLATAIGTPGDQLRERLAGPVLQALRSEFARAAAAKEEVHAALYELRDDELLDLLIAAGARCHVILANGSFSAADPDPNQDAGKRLADAGIDVQRRMVSAGHFAHNKFVVFGAQGSGRVWTGSTNWTPSGLCTQANHAVLIEDPDLADGYLGYWSRLHDAASSYPPQLTDGDGEAAKGKLSPGDPIVRAWCVPVHGFIDLADAKQLIAGAQQGALFLMFRPGNTDTLVDDLKALHERGLFIRGVVNTDFLGPNSAAAIEFFNKTADAAHADPELILPDHLRTDVGPLLPEMGVQGVLIHSKTIVIDPLGPHPVVITGSHNLGQKASAKNDDNLVIIENAPGIAAEFAVYIMNVYDQYKWRYEKGLRAKQAALPKTPGAPQQKQWNGLQRTDAWQSASYLAAAKSEADFWFGATGGQPPPPPSG